MSETSPRRRRVGQRTRLPLVPHGDVADAPGAVGLADGRVAAQDVAALGMAADAVLGEVVPLLVGERAVGGQDLAEMDLGRGKVGEAGRRAVEVAADPAHGRTGDEGADIVDDEAADRGLRAGLPGSCRSGRPASCRPSPPDRRRGGRSARSCRRSTGPACSPRRRASQSLMPRPTRSGQTTRRPVRTRAPRQDVEVPRLAGEPVHADHRALGLLRAPLPVGQMVEAPEGEPEMAPEMRRHRAGAGGSAAISAAVSKTCGAISRRVSASPSFRRMKALVV